MRVIHAGDLVGNAKITFERGVKDVVKDSGPVPIGGANPLLVVGVRGEVDVR